MNRAIFKWFVCLCCILTFRSTLAQDAPPLAQFGPLSRPAEEPDNYDPEIDFNETFVYQEKDEWCWAACCSMIFAFHNHPVEQSKIVEYVYHGDFNYPSMGSRNIKKVLSKVWTDENGNKFRSVIKATFQDTDLTSKLNNSLIAKELASGNPLIVCARNHAMVQTGMEYYGLTNKPIRVDQVNVYDPYPYPDGRSPKRALDPDEITPSFKYITGKATKGSLHFIISVRIEEISDSEDGNSTDSTHADDSTDVSKHKNEPPQLMKFGPKDFP